MIVFLHVIHSDLLLKASLVFFTRIEPYINKIPSLTGLAILGFRDHAKNQKIFLGYTLKFYIIFSSRSLPYSQLLQILNLSHIILFVSIPWKINDMSSRISMRSLDILSSWSKRYLISRINYNDIFVFSQNYKDTPLTETNNALRLLTLKKII